VGRLRPAIERWEAIHGPAPEPLVRRVDDRGAARVERSRLSALGDGVLVQAGWFMGRLLMDWHRWACVHGHTGSRRCFPHRCVRCGERWDRSGPGCRTVRRTR
jgi:hypothetical protein